MALTLDELSGFLKAAQKHAKQMGKPEEVHNLGNGRMLEAIQKIITVADAKEDELVGHLFEEWAYEALCDRKVDAYELCAKVVKLVVNPAFTALVIRVKLTHRERIIAESMIGGVWEIMRCQFPQYEAEEKRRKKQFFDEWNAVNKEYSMKEF